MVRGRKKRPQHEEPPRDPRDREAQAIERWLWTFVARTFVLYRIAASRGADVLTTVLGDPFAGILGSDRLPTYLKYVVGQRQFCWAHYADLQIMPTSVMDVPFAAVPASQRSA
jgi:hypothetical protein